MLKQAIRAVLFSGAVTAAFTPISIQGGGGVASTASCATCCPQEGATCVVCGTSACLAESNYYEGKIGPGGCTNET